MYLSANPTGGSTPRSFSESVAQRTMTGGGGLDVLLHKKKKSNFTVKLLENVLLFMPFEREKRGWRVGLEPTTFRTTI